MVSGRLHFVLGWDMILSRQLELFTTNGHLVVMARFGIGIASMIRIKTQTAATKLFLLVSSNANTADAAAGRSQKSVGSRSHERSFNENFYSSNIFYKFISVHLESYERS